MIVISMASTRSGNAIVRGALNAWQCYGASMSHLLRCNVKVQPTLVIIHQCGICATPVFDDALLLFSDYMFPYQILWCNLRLKLMKLCMVDLHRWDLHKAQT